VPGSRGAYRVAFDLGAGSGRAMLGRVSPEGLRLEEVHRFHYGPREQAGHLRWDMGRLLEGIDHGLRAAGKVAGAHGASVESVGVASWAVDYGLVDVAGELLEEPIAYRDARTEGVMERVLSRVSRREIFERTGIQFLPLNTLYQLFAHTESGLPAGAARLLLIPDLCHHHLCGSLASELTNASTTQLWNPATGAWDGELVDRLGLPAGLLPDVVPPGSDLGPLRADLAAALGARGTRVLAPATHDTASAVAGTPLEAGWAYVSSGTWSLVGLELQAPVLGAAAERANFTNELGACGSVRLLKNVMGLWILDSCRREWQAAARAAELPELLAAAAALPQRGALIAPDAPRFFNPESMLSEIHAFLRETGQAAPDTPAAVVRVILDSLALRYARVLETLEELCGRRIPGLHVVGGGARNGVLNQATADASGRPLRAGPVEATAAGNLLVQALAAREIGSLAEGRQLVERSAELRLFEPRDSAAWEEARQRYREIEARA
jgi:rhamnulokinase